MSFEVRQVVCLVGSITQEADWRHHAERLTKEGYIVFEAGSYDKASPKEIWNLVTEVHHPKIELADIVAIIRKPDGSIGQDTWADVNHAQKHGKEVVDVEMLS